MQVITPDFNRDRFEGQMNPEERRALYELVLQRKPSVVVETGMCRGGGSTYYISSALRNLEADDRIHRTLHTVEFNPEFFEYGKNLYNPSGALGYLGPWVQMTFQNSLPWLLTFKQQIDFLFIDGGADSMAALYDFTTVRHLIPIGGIVSCHDWDNGKTDYIRPVLLNEHDYRPLHPQIIGFMAFERIGDFHQCS